MLCQGQSSPPSLQEDSPGDWLEAAKLCFLKAYGRDAFLDSADLGGKTFTKLLFAKWHNSPSKVFLLVLHSCEWKLFWRALQGPWRKTEDNNHQREETRIPTHRAEQCKATGCTPDPCGFLIPALQLLPGVPGLITQLCQQELQYLFYMMDRRTS